MTHKERATRREQIRQDVREGMPLAVVAEKYGMAYDSIVAIKTGTPHVRVSSRQSTYAILADLINSDELLIHVAARHGVSKQAVSQIYLKLIEAGAKIPLRPKGRKTS